MLISCCVTLIVLVSAFILVLWFVLFDFVGFFVFGFGLFDCCLLFMLISAGFVIVWAWFKC